jgi:hypothetical protein
MIGQSNPCHFELPLDVSQLQAYERQEILNQLHQKRDHSDAAMQHVLLPLFEFLRRHHFAEDLCRYCAAFPAIQESIRGIAIHVQQFAILCNVKKSTLLQIFGPYSCQEPEVRKRIEDALSQIFQFLEGRPGYAKGLHIFRLSDAEPSFPVDFIGNYCPYHLSVTNE